MKTKYIICSFFTFAILVFGSCNKYLDIVPDNIATIENAFSMRDQAEKYLFTCYSYMPLDGDLGQDPAMLGGDEMWRLPNQGGMFDIAKGLQNVVGPRGGDHWANLYQGLRDCNIFLDNINNVPDLSEYERLQWIAEVKFLKAYYHFYLVRMYGPIPLIKESLPVDAGIDEVKISRSPVDSCFAYITELLDEAKDNLPLTINNPTDDLGRITALIALSLKAKVLVTAASPLFNGNVEQAQLKNHDGVPLFNPTFSKEKWQLAAEACKEAIDACHEEGMELYYFNKSLTAYKLTEAMEAQMNIRNSVTEKWNSEIIWANTQTGSNSLQRLVTPQGLDPARLSNSIPRGELSPPLKIAEMFYTDNGVPINEDKEWNYNKRYELRTAKAAEELYIRPNYITINLHFDREPRFYADLGFDGGVWYGQGRYDDKKANELFFTEVKLGQRNSLQGDRSTVTGYFIKKLVHYENVIGASTYSAVNYPWPILRLTDLYLLYAEALNESEGPGPNAYFYINEVRERAGLESVESSWSQYSTNPLKYETPEGLREIIRRERLIEFVFEGQRFWDLRRWKEAENVLNQPIMGWDLSQTTPVAFYVPKMIFEQTFSTREYFWPIRSSDISVNKNLVQNQGW